MYGDIDECSYKAMDRYGGGGEQRIQVSSGMCVESEKVKDKCWFEVKIQ